MKVSFRSEECLSVLFSQSIKDNEQELLKKKEGEFIF